MPRLDMEGPIRLEGNPAVDRDVLRQARAILEELDKLGLLAGASYDLAPALGGSLIGRLPGSSVAARSLMSPALPTDH